MPDTLPCTFYRASWDRDGVRANPTWPQLVARCLDHRIGDKDGPALTCGTFTGPRGNASLASRSLIALDIEANPRTGEVPVAFDACVTILTAKRVRAVMWTTHSHVLEAPRYRVLIPLSEPVPYEPDTDPFLAAAIAAQLGLHGVSDPSKFGAASLFYLPRHPSDTHGRGEHKAQEIAGDPIDSGYALTMALTIAQGVAQDEAAVAARRAANALPAEITARIGAYNCLHVLTDLFPRYGYQRDGNRWKSRYQHGIGATTILPDGLTWVSFSESDAAERVGQRPARASSQCACFGDAFALFCHYEHNNNFRAALNALES